MKKLNFKDLLGIFIVWRCSLLLFSFFALYLLGGFLNPQKVNFLAALSSWDGGHFISIAQNGYQAPEQYAFFPLYPLLIKALAPVFLNNFRLAALFISSLFSLLAIVFFQKLASIDYKNGEVKKSIIFLLASPVAFFLAAAYAESLFVFLACASFYFSRSQRWVWAGVFASFASAAKPFGILLFIVLVFEYLKQKNFKIKKVDWKILLVFIAPCGLLFYMAFLKFKLGNAFFFIVSESNWQRQFIAFAPKVVFEKYLSVFSLENIGTRFFAQQALELFSVIFFIVILVYSVKKLRSTYVLYCILLLLLALSTGVLTSFPRFFLLAFPLFFALPSFCQGRLFEKFLLYNFVLFQGLFLALFLTGIWVA